MKSNFPFVQFDEALPHRIPHVIITILVVVSFLLFPKVGFLPAGAEGFDIHRNIGFMFSHANVFHLLCNVICLWKIRNIDNVLLPAFVIQFLCSLLPEFTSDIMGMSGFLFAIIGIRCGMYNRGKRMVRILAPFFIITAFLPNVAVLFHLYCLTIAFIAGFSYNYIHLWRLLRL